MSRRAHTSIPSGLCMHDLAFRAECQCDCDVPFGVDGVNPQESDVPPRNGRRVHSLLAEAKRGSFRLRGVAPPKGHVDASMRRGTRAWPVRYAALYACGVRELDAT